MLEKTPESPSDGKEIKPINPKGNPPWMLIGRTDVKLKFQYFEYLTWRAELLEKILILGKIEGSEWGDRMRWLDGTIESMNMNLGKLCEIVKDSEDWHAAVHGITKSDTS